MRPPPSPASDGTVRRQRLALWVVALYATLSALWITLSDTLLSWWIPDTETLRGPVCSRGGRSSR